MSMGAGAASRSGAQLARAPIWRRGATRQGGATAAQTRRSGDSSPPVWCDEELRRLEEGSKRAKGMGQEVEESCVDKVMMDMVAAYCGRFYVAMLELAARHIEAIGFQVGHQLTEGYTLRL
ncbi:hypothetical protein ABZP36_008179 [Zizania latifolia]